jgi:hypothetical protein
MKSIMLIVLYSTVYRAEIGTTVSDLLASLKQSDQYNEVNILRDWVFVNGVDVLASSPQTIGKIFALIKSENSDPYFVEIIGKVTRISYRMDFLVVLHINI